MRAPNFLASDFVEKKNCHHLSDNVGKMTGAGLKFGDQPRTTAPKKMPTALIITYKKLLQEFFDDFTGPGALITYY